MRNTSFWWILIFIMLLLDLYVFQVVKLLTQNSSIKLRGIIHISYWVISIAAVLLLFLLPYLQTGQTTKLVRTILFTVIFSLFFAKIIAAIFFLVDDLRRAVQWLANKIFFYNSDLTENRIEGISRSVFLSWAGIAIGGGIFGSLIYGFGNKYNYQVKRLKLAFNNLPPAFKGLKVLHFSDVHSGSLNNKDAVIAGIDKMMKEKPDLILFTGDLVNNTADEMEELKEVFAKLKAPMGVFSTLGNHDYGDYVSWDDADEKGFSVLKKQNLDRLKQTHADMGWRLLMNENVHLEKGSEKIAIIGIENWSSKARFPKYGNLKKAYEGSETVPFKVLLSHDPSHWDAEVKGAYKDIDLTLSGHTHGMQFGVEVPGFKWSPVQYVYKQWAGLYEKEAQKLYVNRGFGFIGYPGRVGILPEITVIELT
jgi:uncharacterized protein